MDTWLIIVIVAAVLLLLLALVLLPRMRKQAAERRRQRELEQARTERAELHRREAEDREREAQLAERRAQEARAEAELREARAERGAVEAREARAEAELHRARADAHERGQADDELGVPGAGADVDRDRDGIPDDREVVVEREVVREEPLAADDGLREPSAPGPGAVSASGEPAPRERALDESSYRRGVQDERRSEQRGSGRVHRPS